MILDCKLLCYVTAVSMFLVSDHGGSLACDAPVIEKTAEVGSPASRAATADSAGTYR